MEVDSNPCTGEWSEGCYLSGQVLDSYMYVHMMLCSRQLIFLLCMMKTSSDVLFGKNTSDMF